MEAEAIFVALVILTGIACGVIFIHDVVDFVESIRAAVEYGQWSHESYPATVAHVCRVANRACGLA